MPEQVNDKKYGITINKKLVVAENEYEVKTRVPFTYGENERHLNFKKEDVKEIHNGKTLLTSLTDNKNYMIYDKNDKVVGKLYKEMNLCNYMETHFGMNTPITATKVLSLQKKMILNISKKLLKVLQ